MVSSATFRLQAALLLDKLDGQADLSLLHMLQRVRWVQLYSTKPPYGVNPLVLPPELLDHDLLLTANLLCRYVPSDGIPFKLSSWPFDDLDAK